MEITHNEGNRKAGSAGIPLGTGRARRLPAGGRDVPGRRTEPGARAASGQDGMTVLGLLFLLLVVAAGVYWWMGRGKKEPEDSQKELTRLEQLQAAAEKGDATAACRLGRMYAEGLEVSQDWQRAATWFRKAAQEGSPEGAYQLGWLAETGNGMPQNWEKAAKWYRTAAEQGYVDAQWRLGLCHRDGRGVAKDPIWAQVWLKKAVEQGHEEAKEALAHLGEASGADPVGADRALAEGGDAAAQCRMGRRYMEGNGVERNDEAGAEWYRKAAEQGHAEAQCRLGDCLRVGKGVAKDEAAAESWYRKAAEQGLAAAQRAVGKCRMAAGDPAESVTWLREAADGGDPEGQYLLALCYRKGMGTGKNPAEARKWLQAAAQNGHPKAVATLKTVESSEMPRLRGRKREWMEELLSRARQGDRHAQYQLGENLVNLGREKDGLGWIQTAAQRGEVEAAVYLGKHWEGKDARQSFLWWGRAADWGSPEAQWQMVDLCRSGTGTVASDTEALRWARKVAEGGDRRAMLLVAEWYEKGIGCRQDYAEAKRWYSRAGDQYEVARMDELISGKGETSYGHRHKSKGIYHYWGIDGKVHTRSR